MGFKVVVSQDPVIAQVNKKQWEEADRLGYFVKDSTNGKSYDMPWPWGGNCGVVDFTLPAVAVLGGELISRNLLTMVSPASGQTWANLPGVTRSRRNVSS